MNLDPQSIIVIFVSFLLCMIIILINHIVHKKYSNYSEKKTNLICVFGFTVFVIISITLLPIFDSFLEEAVFNINVIPLNFISDFIVTLNARHFSYHSVYLNLINIFGNIILFIPFGFVACLLFNNVRKLINILFLSMIFSIIIEFSQYLEVYFRLTDLRTIDIDDIILNTLGGIIGYCIYCQFVKRTKLISVIQL